MEEHIRLLESLQETMSPLAQLRTPHRVQPHPWPLPSEWSAHRSRACASEGALFERHHDCTNGRTSHVTTPTTMTPLQSPTPRHPSPTRSLPRTPPRTPPQPPPFPCSPASSGSLFDRSCATALHTPPPRSPLVRPFEGPDEIARLLDELHTGSRPLTTRLDRWGAKQQRLERELRRYVRDVRDDRQRTEQEHLIAAAHLRRLERWWGVWVTLVRHRQEIARAEGAIRSEKARKAFVAWLWLRHHTREAQAMMAIGARAKAIALTNLRDHHVHRAWLEWRARQRQRARTLVLLRRGTSRFVQPRLARACSTWAAYARRCAHNRHLLERGGAFFGPRRPLAQSFALWRHHTLRLPSPLARCVHYASRPREGRAWRNWTVRASARSARERATRRVLTSLMQRSLTHAVRQWQGQACALAVCRRTALHVCAQLLLRSQCRYWNAWARVATALATSLSRLHSALRLMRHHRLRRGLRSWHATATALVTSRKVIRGVLARMRGRWLSQGWNLWVSTYISRSRTLARASAVYRRALDGRTMRALTTWHGHAFERARRHALARRAVYYLSDRRFASLWTSWIASTQRRAGELYLLRRGAAFLCNRQFAAALGRWRAAITSQQHRELTEALAVVATEFFGEGLRLTLAQWRVKAAKLSSRLLELKALITKADAAQSRTFCPALLRRALRTWQQLMGARCTGPDSTCLLHSLHATPLSRWAMQMRGSAAQVHVALPLAGDATPLSRWAVERRRGDGLSPLRGGAEIADAINALSIYGRQSAVATPVSACAGDSYES